MTVEVDPAEDKIPKKGSKLPLILGLVLAIVGGVGSYFVVSRGAIGGSSDSEEESAADEGAVEAESLPPISFIPLEPILVSLPRNGDYNVLRFRVELEVNAGFEEEVTAISPRIIDVLNGYLRAVTLEELADPTILSRLRSQMLRRVQTVAGEGRIRDILIMEFVLN